MKRMLHEIQMLSYLGISIQVRPEGNEGKGVL